MTIHGFLCAICLRTRVCVGRKTVILYPIANIYVTFLSFPLIADWMTHGAHNRSFHAYQINI